MTNYQNYSNEFINTEYKTMFDYYLWSLRNRHAILTLYMSLFSITVGGCTLLLRESQGTQTPLVAIIGGIFVILGFLLLERLASNTVTSLWACSRLNKIRKHFRDQFPIGLFQDLAGGIYQHGTFMNLFRYKLRAATFIIFLNSLSVAMAVLIATTRLNLLTGLCIAIASAAFFFLMQRIYFNERLDVLKGYLESETKAYQEEYDIINKINQKEMLNGKYKT